MTWDINKVQSAYETEEIMGFVSEYLRLRREEITGNRFPEERKTAIYLIK